MNSEVANIKNIKMSSLVDDLLSYLNPKEKDIIQRRFATDNDKKETLESIGKSYSITRERVRQIEALAIKKLVRIAKDNSVHAIHDIGLSLLEKNGGVLEESILLSKILKQLPKGEAIKLGWIRLSLKISKQIQKQEKNQFYKPFWCLRDLPINEVKKQTHAIEKILKSQKRAMDLTEIIEATKDQSPKLTESLMYVFWDFMQVKKTKQWGLKGWRFLNPRSIKDCITLLFKEIKEPMHFQDILENVKQTFPQKKKTSPQACHNELIRNKEFALIGRGIYGLAEWGFAAGTICDLIVQIFEENKLKPLKRHEIIQKVLEKRDTRVETISLNLQKYKCFERVGRAVYSYNPKLDTRKRRKKA